MQVCGSPKLWIKSVSYFHVIITENSCLAHWDLHVPARLNYTVPFVHSFFISGNQKTELTVRSYRKAQIKTKITHQSCWTPTTPVKQRPPVARRCRCSARSLGQEPTPGSWEVTERRIRGSYHLEHRRRRGSREHHLLLHLHKPDPPPGQIRERLDEHGRSTDQQARGSRPPCARAPGSTAAEGKTSRQQTPHHQRLHLQQFARSISYSFRFLFFRGSSFPTYLVVH